MSGVIRKKEIGEAWETVLDTGGGGGSGLGVWKTYGDDSSNPALDGVTVGDGTLDGRWWTPAAVVPAVETAPFLCILDIDFTLGSTSTIDGNIVVNYPKLVDGSSFDIVTSSVDAIFLAFGHITATETFGSGTVGGTIKSADGTVWDATHPGVWGAPSVLVVSATFQAVFTGD